MKSIIKLIKIIVLLLCIIDLNLCKSLYSEYNHYQRKLTDSKIKNKNSQPKRKFIVSGMIFAATALYKAVKSKLNKENDLKSKVNQQKQVISPAKCKINKVKNAITLISSLKDRAELKKEAKNKPGFLKRLFNFITELTYMNNPKREKREKEFNDNVTLKEKFFDDYVKANKDKSLTDFDIVGIAWFIGKQHPKIFISYQKPITEALDKFLAMKKKAKDRISAEKRRNYIATKYAAKILVLHDDRLRKIMESAPKLYHHLTIQLMQNFIKDLNPIYSKIIKISAEKDISDLKNKLMLCKVGKKQINNIENNSNQEEEVKEEPKQKIDNEKLTHMSRLVIDYINNKAKTTMNYYNKTKKFVKNNALLSPLNDLIEQIDSKVDIDELKKYTLKADVLLILEKIRDGKADIADKVTGVIKAAEALGLNVKFKDEIDIAKTVVSIFKEAKTLGLDKPVSQVISKILLVSSIIVGAVPSYINLSREIAVGLKMVGKEIQNSESLRKYIDERAEVYVKLFEKSYYTGDIIDSSIFPSDFNMDYHTPDIQYNTYLSDYVNEKKEQIKDAVETIAKKVEKQVNDHEEALKNHRCSAFAIVSNDFAIDDIWEYTSKMIEDLGNSSDNDNKEAEYNCENDIIPSNDKDIKEDDAKEDSISNKSEENKCMLDDDNSFFDYISLFN